MFATLAQRQSNTFVKCGSSVQIREVAPGQSVLMISLKLTLLRIRDE